MSTTAVNRHRSRNQAPLSAWVGLRESASSSEGDVEIDEDEGVVRNVKLLGQNSPNRPNRGGRPIPGVTRGTFYTAQALESAVGVFEGAKVRLNHPSRTSPNEDRAVEADLGIVRNVRMTPGGLRGDLHYNRAHPFAARLVEDVKRRLGQWGFSPNAVGVGRVENGAYIVEEIAHCRSIDLVSDPATTVNLWESKTVANTITFHELLEKCVLPKVRGKRRIKLVQFMEGATCGYGKKGVAGTTMEADDPLMADAGPSPLGDTPVPEPEAGTDPEDALWQGFRTTLIAVIDDTDMDPIAKVKRLKELISAHHSLSDKGGDETPAPESEEADVTEDGGEGGEGGKSKKVAAVGMESEAKLPAGKPSGPATSGTVEPSKMNTDQLAESDRTELARLRKKEGVVSLCESLEYTPTGIEIKAMCDLTEGDRRGFIMAQKRSKNRPRTTIPGGSEEVPTRKEKPLAEGPTALADAIKQ